MASSHLPIITIIGSLNTDLVTFTPRVPSGGETLHASSFHTGPGGKGGNQAVACAKLSRSSSSSSGSAEVHMVGAVGADAFGTTMLSSLENFGVKTSSVSVEEGATTGVAVILVEEGTGENRILLSPGANYSLTKETMVSLPTPRPDLIIMQLEIPLETVLHVLDLAEREGVPVLLNPAPAAVLPPRTLRKITHLVLNETEAALLANCSESDLEDSLSLERIASGFQEQGAKNVIITLGGRGVFFKGEKEMGMVSARKVEVVDTTAAGDTFIGAYALEVVKGDVEWEMQKAIEKANGAAAITVGRRGAQESIPWMDEL